MSIEVTADGQTCRLTFDGSITFEFWREMEDIIIDAMRRHTHFDVDLSGVREIDLAGIHLLGLVNSVGGANVRVVAGSPIVDQATQRLLSVQRASSLGRRRAGQDMAAARG